MSTCGECKYYEQHEIKAGQLITEPLRGFCCYDRSTVAWFPVEGPAGPGLQKFFVEREVRRLRVACHDFDPS